VVAFDEGVPGVVVLTDKLWRIFAPAKEGA
jgi:hypothetical protein